MTKHISPFSSLWIILLRVVGRKLKLLLEQIKENYFLFYEKTSFPDSIFVQILPYLLHSKRDDNHALRAFERLKEIHSKEEIQENWELFFSSLIEKKTYFCGEIFGFNVCLPYNYGDKTNIIRAVKNSYFYYLCQM